jgi:hypothetical protein
MGAEWISESAGVAEYRLDVAAAIEALRADTDAQGVQDVLRALEGGRGVAGGGRIRSRPSPSRRLGSQVATGGVVP